MVEKQGSPPGEGRGRKKELTPVGRLFFDGFRDAPRAVLPNLLLVYLGIFRRCYEGKPPWGWGEGISEGGGRGTPTHPLRKNLCCETLLYPFELICPKIYTLGI